jgi:hypothetical protein
VRSLQKDKSEKSDKGNKEIISDDGLKILGRIIARRIMKLSLSKINKNDDRTNTNA